MPAVLNDNLAYRQRLVVGVGDMAVSPDPFGVLSTYSLGSCIAVAAYDGVKHCGGLLHLMLPESSIAPERSQKQPALFADTGIPLLLRAMAGMDSDPANVRYLVAGGASVLVGEDPFKIGERNAKAVLEILGRNGCRVLHTVVGGAINRALHMELAEGVATVTTPLAGQRFTLAE